MPANGDRDAKYLALLVGPMRECVKYRPKFGREDLGRELGLTEFRALYSGDPLYHWVGLDSELMYAAHKAAGGMTSIYRQLGIGCERLLREVAKDELSLTSEQAAWSYEYEKEDGKSAKLTLDLRIDARHLEPAAAARVRGWLSRVGKLLELKPSRVAILRGAVFEVRQGYKSADSKRQNADLRFGMRAAADNYLPVICVVSTQVSETVIRRYRNSALLVLLGTLSVDTESTFAFYRDVVGYDLAAFFTRNSRKLRNEFGSILKGLLTPS